MNFIATIALFFTLAVAGTASAPTPSASDLFRSGDFEGARAAYLADLARSPDDEAALAGLARVELYDNQLDAAGRSASLALARNPADREAQTVAATVRQRQAIAASAAVLDVPAAGVIVPFVESEPLPAIDLRIDGKVGTFLIDTGAPDVTLDPDFAKALGLTLTGASRGTFLGGKTAPVFHATAQRIDVGPVALHDIKVTILPTRGMRMFSARVVDGVVGTVFLSRFLSTIDYPNHRLVLRPRTAALPDSARVTVVPIWLVGDHFIFARGSVNMLDDRLISIDSGGPGVGFMPAAGIVAAGGIEAFPDKAARGMGGGGEVTVIPTITHRVCLAMACQENVPGGYTPSGSPLSIFPFDAVGSVSHAFLERYAVTFDFIRMQMQLADR